MNVAGPDSHTLSGAYVLDALTEIERAAFDRHLATCESCALEVAELREAAARLADGSWSVPPPRLRGAVLSEVGRTRQDRPSPPGRAGRDGDAALSRWRRRAVAAVAAGIVLAGAAATGQLVQEHRVRDERAAARAARLESARIQEVLTAPDAVLRGTTGPGGVGRVTVVSSRRGDVAVAVLEGLPSRGPDRTYQLWVIDDGAARSAGVLATGATGDRRLITGVRGADLFGVTVEPAGGSASPTLSTAVTVPF